MMGFSLPLSRPLWWLVALLSGLLIGLAVAVFLQSAGKATVAPVSVVDVKPADLQREVDATCSAFGIGRKDIRVKQSGAPGGEHRIVVDERFRPLEFHHALSRRLAKWGVNIVGEEQPRQRKIALQLRLEGKQLWSVQLLIQKSSGKENRHRP